MAAEEEAAGGEIYNLPWTNKTRRKFVYSLTGAPFLGVQILLHTNTFNYGIDVCFCEQKWREISYWQDLHHHRSTSMALKYRERLTERVWDRNMGTLYLNTKYAARVISVGLTSCNLTINHLQFYKPGKKKWRGWGIAAFLSANRRCGRRTATSRRSSCRHLPPCWKSFQPLPRLLHLLSL